MSTAMTKAPSTSHTDQPHIIINADELSHIEALAEGAFSRNPALADRLLDELSRARILPPERMPGDVIGIGSRVVFRDEATGQERTVTLVYPEEADIARQRVSVMTPVGVALLGLSEGAAFHWDTRNRQRRMLTVIRVEDTSDPDSQ
ncbi:nucleoside diphosphate kinase regulator [Leisingera caerulea]|uniref:nucleoside diphosphate kinase regulator n=1 Tax=Leisingera caerulea TaxID=506591 RepID=UPI00068877EE|nr:nucleoside diphosphate kinase regulator [Leisingera caerulea]